MTKRTDALAIAAVALATHAATAWNLLYTHDGWNDVVLGEAVLAGELPFHENLLRILPTLSFGVRAASGLWMPAWHLPNLLLHALCAALVVILTRRLGGGPWSARLAGGLFAVAPLLAHPVEWVGGSYDLFATAGLLGAAVATIDGRRWWALAAAAVALLSKESGATVAVVAGLAALGAGVTLRQALRTITPLAILTLIILGLRAGQVWLTPEDALAGRTVEARPLDFLGSGPAGVGIAAAAPLVELLGLRSPDDALFVGWVALSVLVAAVALRRRQARPVGALAAASLVTLLPVSLIAMDAGEMVQNARYLYAAAAFVAPALPLLLLSRPPRAPEAVVAAALAGLALWGGIDRVARSVEVTAAARPVADAVLELPPASQVAVLTGFYDEPTARFLMSGWLARSRGIRARYVMRGTWIAYSRRAGVSHDAAQAYFGPEYRAFDPQQAQGSLLLQDVVGNTATWVEAPEPSPAGPWMEVDPRWTPLPPDDPEDPPITITNGGRTLHTERFLGPVASARDIAEAALDLPGEGVLSAVEITLRVRSDARLRYATGYHERFAALFFGPPFDAVAAVSMEVRADGQPQTFLLELSRDPALANLPPTSLGLLPLNYPGEVTVERLRIRR